MSSRGHLKVGLTGTARTDKTAVRSIKRTGLLLLLATNSSDRIYKTAVRGRRTKIPTTFRSTVTPTSFLLRMERALSARDGRNDKGGKILNYDLCFNYSP